MKAPTLLMLLVLLRTQAYSTFNKVSKQTANYNFKPVNLLLNDTMVIIGDDYYKNTESSKLSIDTIRTNINNYHVINKDLHHKKYQNKVRFNMDSKKTLNVISREYDEVYTGREDLQINSIAQRKIFNNKDRSIQFKKNDTQYFRYINNNKRTKRDSDIDKCEKFRWSTGKSSISHPRDNSKNSSNFYSSSTDCVTIINATENSVIKITFTEMFHIESHPKCAYDYLEIRDGPFGFNRLLDTLCGDTFPKQYLSTGPYMWLKFHSDDTIEYEGFNIEINIEQSSNSYVVPDACRISLTGKSYGVVDSASINGCRSKNSPLDVLWKIVTPENTKIYLNFTTYSLAKPNECEENDLEVYGSVLEYNSKLVHYCGSMANPVTTKGIDGKDDKGNIMHIRLYASKAAAKNTFFNATYTAFRTLDPNDKEKCDPDTEFDCEDNTCIAWELKCDRYAHCRLKTDENYELCKGKTESVISKPHILVILVIFSLILSGMSFVFLFKCIRKLYQDHKIIKEHIRQSCEDNLLTILDAKQLQQDIEPRASLERENHTNEMFKQHRKFSLRKPTSIDSDYIEETHVDLDDESWHRETESIPIETEEVRIERNGKTRRNDISKKEQSMRRRSMKESLEKREKKEIRDVSVGAPDTKESGCQTRESLFQVGTGVVPSSESNQSAAESATNSRGFSTFGYSGATVVRPSPPVPSANTSEITIELLRQVPSHQDSVKSQKKMPDRRPISVETTRSAPDVIIVSKPIR